jgi:hypothetical protein
MAKPPPIALKVDETIPVHASIDTVNWKPLYLGTLTDEPTLTCGKCNFALVVGYRRSEVQDRRLACPVCGASNIL